MNRTRLLILLFGPWPILWASVAISRWMRPAAASVVARNEFETRPSSDPSPTSARALRSITRQAIRLEQLCQQTGDELRARLADHGSVIERPPLVIGGDLSEAALDEWHQKTIAPAMNAMIASYAMRAPDQPITVLLFNGETSYNRYSRDLYGDAGISVFGYYKPREKTLVMNIATGGGTLVHELTHALLAFDFPTIPDWLNEGLASLHEQCRVLSSEGVLEGLPNWRLPVLAQAMAAGRMRPLQSLIGDDDFRHGDEGLNYAEARYFCMFLQSRGVLKPLYLAFRSDWRDDRQGIQAVQRLFPGESWPAIDKQFRGWVEAQSKATAAN